MEGCVGSRGSSPDDGLEAEGASVPVGPVLEITGEVVEEGVMGVADEKTGLDVYSTFTSPSSAPSQSISSQNEYKRWNSLLSSSS